MKFTIARSRFLDGLKSVQNVVAGKGSLPVLQNVLLEAEGTTLTMTTTDLDISIRCTVDCEVQEPGATTLPVKLQFDLQGGRGSRRDFGRRERECDDRGGIGQVPSCRPSRTRVSAAAGGRRGDEL